ncbi:SRPBCC domain-containing protein [Microbacterium sp. AZCO]|uniref:SRPBCC family protein n=1 Tax=Microbacterium sp. AZCO TaxID=3142976 RepID=UPI0031F36128
MTEYFTITRTLSAPRQLVFDALTKPEHFAVWFGTAAVEVPQDSLKMDVRVGGEFRAVMLLPDGNRIDWAGEYVEVDPPARLAMTLTDNPDQYAGLPVLFDLAEVDGGTELTIRQDRADFSDEQVAATIAGYNSFIDDIEKELVRMQNG